VLALAVEELSINSQYLSNNVAYIFAGSRIHPEPMSESTLRAAEEFSPFGRIKAIFKSIFI